MFSQARGLSSRRKDRQLRNRVFDAAKPLFATVKLVAATAKAIFPAATTVFTAARTVPTGIFFFTGVLFAPRNGATHTSSWLRIRSASRPQPLSCPNKALGPTQGTPRCMASLGPTFGAQSPSKVLGTFVNVSCHAANVKHC